MESAMITGCVAGTFGYGFCCCLAGGDGRGHIEEFVGLRDSGLCINAGIHLFCAPCALAQEARAVERRVYEMHDAGHSYMESVGVDKKKRAARAPKSIEMKLVEKIRGQNEKKKVRAAAKIKREAEVQKVKKAQALEVAAKVKAKKTEAKKLKQEKLKAATEKLRKSGVLLASTEKKTSSPKHKEKMGGDKASPKSKKQQKANGEETPASSSDDAAAKSKKKSPKKKKKKKKKTEDEEGTGSTS
jgi:hypothetical protein